MPPPHWRPTLEDYIDVAAFLLAATPDAIRSLPRIGSAASAIHAPFASFGGADAYPELLDQAAAAARRELSLGAACRAYQWPIGEVHGLLVGAARRSATSRYIWASA